MPLKICIASPEIDGPSGASYIGMACAGLARELSRSGHQVTLLYASETYQTGGADEWRRFYLELGIDYVPLAESSPPHPYITPNIYETNATEISYRIFRQLKGLEFDIIHFPDRAGIGYFSALARRQGLAFADTEIRVTSYGPTLWSRIGNSAPCDDIAFHIRDRLERGSVAHCDMLLSPTQWMIDILREQNWMLPTLSVVVPCIVPEVGSHRLEGGRRGQPVNKGVPNELVFYGSIERQDGVVIFCDAIERILDKVPRETTVTFLTHGLPSLDGGMLEARMSKWPLACSIVEHSGTLQAVSYLQKEGRLAVMPFLNANAPYAILECLHYDVPFIASNLGGIAELILPEDREGVLCAPDPISLAQAIIKSIRSGGLTARPVRAQDEVRATHIALHAGVMKACTRPALPAEGVNESDQPLVSVCLLHHERGRELIKAVESLYAQSYRNFEIIVVDNGSTQQTTISCLSELERDTDGRLRIIRLPENIYEAGARNAAAAAAKGKYLLFMDDDNRAKPLELELFVRAACRTGADIYVCFADHFYGDDPPDSETKAAGRFVTIGDAGPAGLVFNAFGDLNCFVKHDSFLRVGGFVEDRCFNHAEDWRFFARAWASGLKISIVPEALVWYKAAAGLGNWRKRDRAGAQYRVMAAYLAGKSADDGLLPLSQGLFWKALDMRQEIAALHAKSDQASIELLHLTDLLRHERSHRAVKTHRDAGFFRLLRYGFLAMGPAGLPSTSRLSLFLHYLCVRPGAVRDLVAVGLSGYFDPTYYLRNYPDVAAMGLDPLLHYMDFGASERRNPSELFDSALYLQRYPDVEKSGINPLLHYIRFGREERRFPVRVG